MVTAEILKPCVVCCQPGSVVSVTELQFGCLGDAARRLDDDATISLAEVPQEAPEITTSEIGENAPEIPENAAEPETESPEAATPEVAESAAEVPQEAPEPGKKAKRKKG